MTSDLKFRLGVTLAELRAAPALVPMRILALAGSVSGRRYYEMLSEQALRATRRSDTLFVFGSGYSINDLSPDDVRHFEEHDTLSFNWFVHQHIVRVDYHLIREIAHNAAVKRDWRPEFEEYFELVRDNPLYAQAVFLVQGGLRGFEGNLAITRRLLPRGARVFRWRTRIGRTSLGRTFAEGLSHAHSTLDECINFGALLGWRRIVLVGVDLYDRRYFWLGPTETRVGDLERGATYRDPHNRADSGMLDLMQTWARELAQNGIELTVYNPRSLLTAVLPRYTRPSVPARGV